MQKQEQDSDLETAEDLKNLNQTSWDVYTNDEYGFEIAYPRLLREIEIESEGDYEFFVRFEETEFSQGKGVAVGASKASLDEEVEKISSNFKEEFGMEPSLTSKAEIYGHPAVAMQYSPGEGYEPRSIIIINNGSYTFSISSTPEQMDTLVESLVFK